MRAITTPALGLQRPLFHRGAVGTPEPEATVSPLEQQLEEAKPAAFLAHRRPWADQAFGAVLAEVFSEPDAASYLLDQLSAESRQGTQWPDKASKLAGALDWAFANEALSDSERQRFVQLMRPTLTGRSPDYLSCVVDVQRELLLSQPAFADHELEAVAASAWSLREQPDLVSTARSKLTAAQRRKVFTDFEAEMNADPKNVSKKAERLFYLAGDYEEYQEKFLPHLERVGDTLMKVLARPLVGRLTEKALARHKEAFSDPQTGPQAFIDSLALNRRVSSSEDREGREKDLVQSWSERVGPWILEPQNHFHPDQMLSVYNYLKDKDAAQWGKLKNSQSWVKSATQRMMLNDEGSRNLSAAHYRTDFHTEFPKVVEMALVPMHMDLREALEFSVEVIGKMEKEGLALDPAYQQALQGRLELSLEPSTGEELGLDFEEDLVVFDGIALPIQD